MYNGPISKIRVNDSYSDDISVKVGVHQGSVLSPLLFIIVLEALSKEFRTACPWELFYADDLIVLAETSEALREKLSTWKHNFELKDCVRQHEENQIHGKWTQPGRSERLWAVPLWCVQERSRCQQYLVLKLCTLGSSWLLR